MDGTLRITIAGFAASHGFGGIGQGQRDVSQPERYGPCTDDKQRSARAKVAGQPRASAPFR
ncbi:hypothetical protein MF672_030725 [Actinomadura sp. ATCC 31491]|uniref:Uncharacterized protein n=1 Tax=Actinomadura luzonensis TaxID=2805427 RepID=A0ABT0G208_9ACTN|nr:hypothetical protein [Actinomadura luzonensis]MCK2218131.1 hypothetical protein [Actinomadura luzonensis]